MKHRIAALLAALLSLTAAPALAQCPTTMPANTVAGRGAIPAAGGPCTAIPLSTLATQLIPGLTPGSVIFGGTAGFAQDNANFFYNPTTKTLELGTKSFATGLRLFASGGSGHFEIADPTYVGNDTAFPSSPPVGFSVNTSWSSASTGQIGHSVAGWTRVLSGAPSTGSSFGGVFGGYSETNNPDIGGVLAEYSHANNGATGFTGVSVWGLITPSAYVNGGIVDAVRASSEAPSGQHARSGVNVDALTGSEFTNGIMVGGASSRGIQIGGSWAASTAVPTTAIEFLDRSNNSLWKVDGTGIATASKHISSGIATSAKFLAQRANGTLASPTAVVSGNVIAEFDTGGYANGAYVNPETAMAVTATENWTSSARGRRIEFYTVALGTTAPVLQALINDNGQLVLTQPLPTTGGGTGFASYAVGDLLYASTTTALSKLSDVATGNALITGGVGVAPSYGKIGLATHVSGTLPAANGGFGGDVSASSGVPLFAAGVPTFTSTSGTGNFARVTSPTFVTPTLGAATATSINGNTITTGTGVLTLGAGKTATISNTLTFTGPDSTTLDFGAWTVRSMSVSDLTAGSGTITGATVTVTGRYKTWGKSTLIEGTITLTNVGSGTPGGFVGYSIPNTPASVGFANGMTGGASAVSGFINAAANHIEFYLYNGTSIWANGTVIYFSGLYENT